MRIANNFLLIFLFNLTFLNKLPLLDSKLAPSEDSHNKLYLKFDAKFIIWAMIIVYEII